MIHPLADVQSESIGKETLVWQFCVILRGAKIGSNCNINCNVFIENDVIIGNDVTIKPGVQIWDGMRIGDKVFIGSNVTFTNDNSPRSKHPPLSFLKIIIEEGASIGANSTILPEITIERYSMIGAGSVVTCSIPAFSLWHGNPATHKGYVTKGGKIIDLNLKDKNGGIYRFCNGEPISISY